METDTPSLAPVITIKSLYDNFEDMKKKEEEDLGTAMLPPDLSISSKETMQKSPSKKENKLVNEKF